MIEVQNVSKTYPTGIQANQSLGFPINCGGIRCFLIPAAP